MKESFVFYASFYRALQKLKNKSLKADIYDAICELALNENVVELDDEVGQIILELVKPQILANQKRYEDGNKGGRPRNIDEKQIEELILLGKNNNEIATIMSCSVSTVKTLRQKINSQNDEELETGQKLDKKSKTGQKPVNNLGQKLDKNWSETGQKVKNYGFWRQKPNDNVNDNENVNVNENYNENENINNTALNNKNTREEKLLDLVKNKMQKDLSEKEIEIVKSWRDVPSDLVVKALNESVLYHAKSLSYTNNILNRLLEERSSAVNEVKTNENSSAVGSKELFDYDWLGEGDES